MYTETEIILKGALVISKELREELNEKQAKIDSLMLEYCPDEMSEEQIKTWGENQKSV